MRAETRPYRVVIVTLDSHAAGPVARAARGLAAAFPGLTVSVHGAAEWAEDPLALDSARRAVAAGDLIIANMIFLEEHVRAILPDLEARRESCDAMVGFIASGEVVRLTRMGGLDMSRAPGGALGLLRKLRKLRGKSPGGEGKSQMAMLRRLPRLLRFIPGKAQDLRAWFLVMQYWLAGSDDNVDAMIRFLVARYAHRPEWRKVRAAEPVQYPEVGLYHPRIATDPAELPSPPKPQATIGLLIMRAYVLAGDTAHYDALIEAFEAKGLRVVPAFASGLDARPAVAAYFAGDGRAKVDAVVSLTGFSLVGGPAYNDSKMPPRTSSPASTRLMSRRIRWSSRPSANGPRARSGSGRSRRRCSSPCPRSTAPPTPRSLLVGMGRTAAKAARGYAQGPGPAARWRPATSGSRLWRTGSRSSRGCAGPRHPSGG